MNRLPHFEQTYKVFTPILTTRYTQSEIGLGLDTYNSVIDATQVNTSFSCRVDDSSYKWNDSRITLSFSDLNTSAVIFSTKMTLQDINDFKDAAYLKQISKEQLAHFIGATYL